MGLYGSTKVETKVSETTRAAYSPQVERALLDIAKRTQAMSEEQWALAKEVYEPYERAMVDYNMKMLPKMEELTGLQLEAEKKGVDLYGLQVEEAKKDILEGRPVKEALREQQLKELGLAEPVTEKFYGEALTGIKGDVRARMGEATADVTQAYKGATGALRREAARMGIKLTADDIKDIALRRAKDIGFARTGAREREERRVEDVNWSRLLSAMQARGRATGLPGTQVQTGAQPVAVAEQVGGYGLTDPRQTALAATGAATGTYGMTARTGTRTGTTTRTESGGEGWGLLGAVTGAAMPFALNKLFPTGEGS